jgi:hypothetical protein
MFATIKLIKCFWKFEKFWSLPQLIKKQMILKVPCLLLKFKICLWWCLNNSQIETITIVFLFFVGTFICWILKVYLFVSCHYFEWRFWRCFPSKLFYFSFHMPLFWTKDLEVNFIHQLFLCGIWTLFISSSVTFEVLVVSFIRQCFFFVIVGLSWLVPMWHLWCYK